LEKLGGDFLASGSNDNTVKIWNFKTGACLKTLSGHTYKISALILLNDGNLASGSKDKTIKIWNPNTGALLTTLTDKNEIQCLDLLGEDILMSGTSNGMVKFWNTTTRSAISELSAYSLNPVEALINFTMPSNGIIPHFTYALFFKFYFVLFFSNDTLHECLYIRISAYNALEPT
jgi:WD40 repeat protein